MPKNLDPYSRVYWRILDDDKFVTVYDDDHAFALWVRLLMAADMAFPASASLPHGVRRTALKVLTGVGLVDLQTGSRFRIHGLDKERATRSKAAQVGANARWSQSEPDAGADDDGMQPHSERNAGALRSDSERNAEGMPSQDEPSRAEQRRAETRRANGRAPNGEPDRHGLPHITPAVQEAGEAITGQGMLAAGENQLTELDRQVEVHGAAAVIAAMQTAADGKRFGWRKLVWDSLKLLEPFATGKVATPEPPLDPASEAYMRLSAADRRAADLAFINEHLVKGEPA